MFKMALLASDGLTPVQRVAALRDLLKVIDDAEVKRQVLWRLAALLVESQGRWVPEAVAVTEEILRTNPPHEQASRTIGALLKTARISQDTATLDRILALVRDSKIKSPMLKREMSFIGIEALLSRAVIENGAAEVKRLARDARRGLDELARQKTPFLDQSRIGDLRGRAYMVEAQKLVALAGPTEALPVLLKAKDHYLARLPGNPQQSLSRLEAVGRLLEHTEEWETAVAVYRELATRFPHLQQGRDALLKIARLHERNLNAPLEAVEAYADYAARYPAELPYRQLALGKRLQRLGYANLLDFQKRRHLKADGIFGPKTAAALAKAERSFDVISVRRRSGPGLLRGVFVHPYIFRIARRLDKAGRHHDAVVAYRTFLNLFPTKREADDALIAIARLMRDNLLFAEALGAYRQLMDDFPKGNVTSEAYVEAGGCCENLAMWGKAPQ
ncbi:MAG: peptidoglycan-binding domain-containing protein, partial [Planctomycetia bacterium]|nr:peptidoglycan-binding domain-containing protein [Planctomycetia bacterium]